ncbi:hypothetical protein [Ruminococcus sp.]|uniref:hypothetical protein n=1 Tax=Ruminococcus sp. TaxID=41978 RepID=UPI0025F41426|nr:hypothetical protein [Ruminococcus sp.]
MKDLTELFRKGIENGTGYNDYDVLKAINTLSDISCDYDDDGCNWRLILKDACTTEARILGFISRYYPVALLVEKCPEKLLDKLREENVTIGFFGRDFPKKIRKKQEAETIIIDHVENNYPKRDIIKLEEKDLVISCFDESFSCDEEILRKYAPFKTILDDSFLDDVNFALDDERLFYIYENIPYITPYNFTFDEIR